MIISLSSSVLQSRSHSKYPPPPPTPPCAPPPLQLFASESDQNLSGIPSSWSACWAVHSTQMHATAPTLAQACLDYLHPRWCNPVLDRRMSARPCYFILNLFLSVKGSVRKRSCVVITLCSFSHFKSTLVSSKNIHASTEMVKSEVINACWTRFFSLILSLFLLK